jgi:putative SOS response-associated peptidase YedK
MCGKFTQMASWSDVVAFSTPVDQPGPVPTPPPALATATPMRFAHVIRLDAAGRREAVPMRWGFSDRRAGAPERPRHMHARSETVDRLPTFAESFAERRGILLTHTFNEGEELASGKTRQWTVSPRDGQPIAIAVIYEAWARDEERLLTFVMLTTPPNPLIATITDRMPAILPPEAWSVWLGETAAPLEEVKALLRTYDDGGNWDFRPEPPRPKAPRKPEPDDDQPGLV